MIRQLTIAALALTLAGAAWADVPGLINYQGTLPDDQGTLPDDQGQPMDGTFTLAELPGLINYQGTLQDEQGEPMDGTFTLEFRVWATPEDGEEEDLLWGQSYIVQVHGGQFNVILGAPGGGLPGTTHEDLGEVFARHGQTYLGITVTTDGENEPLSPGVSEIGPRVQILPAPYALHAESVSPQGGGAPVGSVMAFAGHENFIPDGWLLCDGREVAVADYPELNEVLTEHRYGITGDTDTFHLPDYRGFFLRGTDMGVGRDPDVNLRFQQNTGVPMGDQVGSWQEDMFGEHSHSYQESHSVEDIGTPDGTFNRGNSRLLREATETGLRGGNETRPKNVNVHYIIKY